MSEIIPAILEPKDDGELGEKAGIFLGKAPLIHIDVLEKDVWDEIENEFEAHLMVKDPEVIIGRWVDRGAKRIVVHELNKEILIHQGLVEIGLGVLLETPLNEIFDLIVTADYLHFMSIAEIGAQGHVLDERIFDRIKKVKEVYPETIIAVDGGINLDNAPKLLEAGADRLIIGSAIFGAEDPEEAYENFLEII
ncbi:MAG: hypothetical protein AAB690_02445 [Patescibacteria group bacterium]